MGNTVRSKALNITDQHPDLATQSNVVYWVLTLLEWLTGSCGSLCLLAFQKGIIHYTLVQERGIQNSKHGLLLNACFGTIRKLRNHKLSQPKSDTVCAGMSL